MLIRCNGNRSLAIFKGILNYVIAFNIVLITLNTLPCMTTFFAVILAVRKLSDNRNVGIETSTSYVWVSKKSNSEILDTHSLSSSQSTARRDPHLNRKRETVHAPSLVRASNTLVLYYNESTLSQPTLYWWMRYKHSCRVQLHEVWESLEVFHHHSRNVHDWGSQWENEIIVSYILHGSQRIWPYKRAKEEKSCLTWECQLIICGVCWVLVYDFTKVRITNVCDKS
jgi:hypothetical protein